MEQKQNYQIALDAQLNAIAASPKKPTLLLHACCAPCSSYVLEYLSEFFDITLFFYNPNISPESEYSFRAAELERLIKEMPLKGNVRLIVPVYTPDVFTSLARGLEEQPERGSRCTECYRERLTKTFLEAEKNGFDYFSTTLSISPHKDADRLNAIGQALARNSTTQWLFSDFKKKNGYKRSIELSKIYNLYRQDYCGCIYSKK